MSLFAWMLMPILMAGPADANACPELRDLLTQAWDAFDEAELDTAKRAVDEGIVNLGCQTTIVTTVDLLDLYRLSALVALGQADQRAATYAILRAVVADPDSEPPAALGPVLLDYHQVWLARMMDNTALMVVDGGGDVYVDGHPIGWPRKRTVLEGEHLVQIDRDGTIESYVVDVITEHRIKTGLAEPDPPPESENWSDASPASETVVISRRRGRPSLIIAGGATVAVGGAALLAGYLLEQQFVDTPYSDREYGGCSVSEACYASNRETVIRRDAAVVRGLYGSGYAMVGVGVGVVGVGAVVMRPLRGGAAVGVELRW